MVGTHHKISNGEENDETNAENRETNVAVQLVANDLERLRSDEHLRIGKGRLQIVPALDQFARGIHLNESVVCG